jgi:hypothetical protein
MSDSQRWPVMSSDHSPESDWSLLENGRRIVSTGKWSPQENGHCRRIVTYPLQLTRHTRHTGRDYRIHCHRSSILATILLRIVFLITKPLFCPRCLADTFQWCSQDKSALSSQSYERRPRCRHGGKTCVIAFTTLRFLDILFLKNDWKPIERKITHIYNLLDFPESMDTLPISTRLQLTNQPKTRAKVINSVNT